MPRTAAQNETLRAATRERLLDAALTLFAREGFKETTVKAIANRAGVAAGLLYAHYDGKEALLRALFEKSMGDVRASFAIAERSEPAGRLDALVRAAVDTVRANLDFWRLGYAARAQPAVLAALGPALEGWNAAILETLRGYLAGLGSTDPAADARALFAQIDGMCQHFALDPEGYPMDRVADRVVARWTASSTNPENTADPQSSRLE